LIAALKSLPTIMKARYKGPAGTGIIELTDSATVGDLLSELRTLTGIASFTIKYGPPMAMKNLDLGLIGETARSAGLHGETLTIVPAEEPPTPVKTEAAKSSANRSSDNDPGDINVPWREREGTLRKSHDTNNSTENLIKNSSACHA
jgi:ubiquitin thioesterase OTU1